MTFAKLTELIARASGHPVTVALSFILVVVWAALGPHYHWSEDHQLFINTSTTIITFWLCFLVLSVQNRDGLAIQTKLDELIRSSNARNEFIGIDHLSEDDVAKLRNRLIESDQVLPPSNPPL